ncbi:MAG TPA: hypothetical protein VMU65_00115 [Candidatus Saccharimonadales bacterium]|nr:hypothetical protein [Candidatus Saccharimonadales bacterium]
MAAAQLARVIAAVGAADGVGIRGLLGAEGVEFAGDGPADTLLAHAASPTVAVNATTRRRARCGASRGTRASTRRWVVTTPAGANADAVALIVPR